MNRYSVSWKHILGGANTEYVYANNAEAAKLIIENRMGAANLTKIMVRPY